MSTKQLRGLRALKGLPVRRVRRCKRSHPMAMGNQNRTQAGECASVGTSRVVTKRDALLH